MAWTPNPSIPLYDQDALFVFTSFPTITFSYTDDNIPALETFAVTGIVASEQSQGVTVGTSSISGAYSGSNHGGLSVFYLKKDKTYETVTSFNDIEDAYEICRYNPVSQRYKTYNYAVTAVGNLGTIVTANYTLITTFNWDQGKIALQNAVAATRIGR